MFSFFFFAIYDACHLLSVCQVKTKKKSPIWRRKTNKKELKKR